MEIRRDERVRCVFRGCPARIGVQAGSDERNGDQAHAEGAVMSSDVKIVVNRLQNSREGEEVFLSAEMKKIPAASG